METANRHHFNAPTPATAADRAKLAASYARNASPAYSLADALKHGGMIVCALVVLGVIF